jgi:transposase
VWELLRGRRAAIETQVKDGLSVAKISVLLQRCVGPARGPVYGRQRKVHALIFSACYSRHTFAWLSFTQNLATFIAGCDAA